MTMNRPQSAKVPNYIIRTGASIIQPRRAILMFGEQDTGKSWAAYTFPDPFSIYFDTNLATLSKFPDVPFVVPNVWRELEETWIPAIRNRKLSEMVGKRVQTVVIDSLSFCNKMVMDELSQRGKMAMENLQWSELYARLSQLVGAGAGATKPHPSNPQAETYHFICTVHKTIRMGKKGEVLKVAPTVDGQLRDQLFSYFDAVLVCDSQSIPREVVIEPGKPPKIVQEKQRFAWTVDPDTLTKSKNHIGAIPPKVIPTYDVLARYWNLDGIKEEPLPNEVVEVEKEDK